MKLTPTLWDHPPPFKAGFVGTTAPCMVIMPKAFLWVNYPFFCIFQAGQFFDWFAVGSQVMLLVIRIANHPSLMRKVVVTNTFVWSNNSVYYWEPWWLVLLWSCGFMTPMGLWSIELVTYCHLLRYVTFEHSLSRIKELNEHIES